MIRDVDFCEAFPEFRGVPENIGAKRMLPHLIRQRYGLSSLNFTYLEWQQEALQKLIRSGYKTEARTWMADLGSSTDDSHTRRVVCTSPNGEIVRFFYVLGAAVEPKQTPRRLLTRKI